MDPMRPLKEVIREAGTDHTRCNKLLMPSGCYMGQYNIVDYTRGGGEERPVYLFVVRSRELSWLPGVDKADAVYQDGKIVSIYTTTLGAYTARGEDAGENIKG